METLFDRIILFVCCCLYLIMTTNTVFSLVGVLLALSVSALSIFFENTIYVKIFSIMYLMICLVQPYFSIFLPLILYDAMWYKDYKVWAAQMILLFWYIVNSINIYTLFLILPLILSYWLMRRTKAFVSLNNDYKRLRDTSKELSLLLESKNRALIEKQDYEIHVATLKERNRIAREIHDNVGHLLSRSILMMGATIAMNKDETLSEPLTGVKVTLSGAMDSIRQSVHDLHDESIDMEGEIMRIVSGFSFCQITYEYDMDQSANRILKYSFISIIKEALSNVIKHSNATKVHIIVREHPGIYQLLIQDNGTVKEDMGDEGIGLVNMKERVLSMNGTIFISNENGFRIFVSIHKNEVLNDR